MINLLNAQAYHIELMTKKKKQNKISPISWETNLKILDPNSPSITMTITHQLDIFMTNLFATKAHGMHGSICGLQ